MKDFSNTMPLVLLILLSLSVIECFQTAGSISTAVRKISSNQRYSPTRVQLQHESNPRPNDRNIRRKQSAIQHERAEYSTSSSSEEEEEENDDDDHLMNKSTGEPLPMMMKPIPETQQHLERYRYLHDATLRLLNTQEFPPGSFIKGKWHELYSMLVAWSKWINTDIELLSRRTGQDQQIVSHAHPTDVPLLVESILKRMIDEQAAGNTNVQIKTHMYNIILEAWLATIHKSSVLKRQYNKAEFEEKGTMCMVAAQRSLDILKKMQSEYELKKDDNIKPNFFSFLTVLKTWLKACSMTSIPSSEKNVSSHLASRKAHQTLQWMEYLAKSGRNESAKPNALAYTMVLDAYGKSGEKDAGTKAEALLRQMQKENMELNLFCYNLVINAYTRQGRRGGAVDNAERILHEVEDIYQQTGNPAMKPDVVTYTSLVTAWANSNRRGYGANRAEEILNRMIEAGCEPNTVTFNAVLKAWCRSAEMDASERALDIFKRMEMEHANGNRNVKTDRITFNTLIHTLAKSGKSEHLQRAEELLEIMERSKDERVSPNSFSYNTIIEGWSKVRDGNGAHKAYATLQKLLAAEKSGKGIHADSFSFNNVIFALSRSGLKSSALRAEGLLQFMDKEHKSGNTRIKPDVFGYSATIHAWASSGDKDAGIRAEALLELMEQKSISGEYNLKPNTVTYNSCIDCWAKSGQGIFAARKAEKLLEKMETLYKNGDVSLKPTTRTYNSVLLAWAKSNTKCAHWKSVELLNHMWEQYQSGDIDLKPDALAYNTVIDAISKSHREDKAQMALRILRTMDKLYRAGQNKDARPSEFTYTSVLNSCAFSSVCSLHSRKKALDTAIFTLEELQESPYGRPNHVTYGMFLKACANLIPMDDDRRRVVVEPVFLQCCKDGQVGENVLRQLRLAAPEDLYRKLLSGVRQSGAYVTLEDIPEEWRCNVKDDRNRRRKFRNRKFNEAKQVRP